MFWQTVSENFIQGIKDPNAVLDYSIDFSAWLTDIMDSYFDHSIENITGGITLNSSSASNGIITCWFSGGTLGVTASFTVRLHTANGRTDDRTFYLKIMER